MAPSTALLFVLFGAAIFACACVPQSRALSGIGTTIGAIGALVALALLFLSYQDVRPSVELLGLPIKETINGMPIGHMSKVTALCFVLAGAALTILAWSSPIRAWRVRVTFLFASVIILVCIIFLLAYLFGMPLLYEEGLIPPALTTMLAFTALAIALLAFAQQRTTALQPPARAATPGEARRLVLVYALVCASLVGVGFIYAQSQKNSYREQVERELAAISELKVAELANWRAERVADATLLLRSTLVSSMLRHVLRNPRDGPAHEQLQGLLREIREYQKYSYVTLLDARGVAQILVPEESSDQETDIPPLESLRSGEIRFIDFHRDGPRGAIHLSLLVPITNENGGALLGVLYLAIDPTQYLYPFIQRWPTRSASAETLLLRREGNDALFLNELKFRTNTALALRIPLDSTDVPAVKAVRGEEGVVDGMDYRGVPVIASVRQVPGSPWFLVARIDSAEVFAPVRERLWLTAGLVAALLLAASAAATGIWRHQHAHYYRERSRAAEALAASTRRYQVLTRTATDAIVTADTAGVIVGWNPAAERLFGHSEADALGQSLTMLMPARYREAHLAGVARIQTGAQARLMFKTVELHGLTKGGNEFPLELSLSQWETAEGQFFTGIMRDISDRKQAETALARRGDLYNLLSQTNQAIVRITSREELFPIVCRNAVQYGHFRFACIGLVDPDSQGVRAVAHYGEDAGYVDALHASADEWSARGRGPIGQALRSGAHVVTNDFLADAAVLPWHEAARRVGIRSAGAFPLRERDAVVGVICLYSGETGFFTDDLLPTLDEMTLDVSFALTIYSREKERLHALAALRESEDHFRSLYENAPLAYQSLDAAGNIITVNTAWQEMFGRTREEVTGRFFGDFVTEASMSTLEKNFPTLKREGRMEGLLFEIVGKDGSPRIVAVNGRISRDAEGNFRHTHCILTDMTERSRHEMELRILNERLEQRVEERTRALQVANRELEAFSYSVSHDLRAPLRAINGFSALLEEQYAEKIDEQGKDMLRRLCAGADKMGHLIDDLLNLSKISRREMQIEPVDLSLLAHEAAEELQASEPGRQVEWIIVPHASAKGDRGLLQVALQNLLGNAWKYSSKREQARIEFGVVEKAGRVTYFVRDNGAGFDMAYAHKLFGAFQRLHPPTEFPGTGIGLATVARIIRRHGGEVWAEGAVNAGASFYFCLGHGCSDDRGHVGQPH